MAVLLPEYAVGTIVNSLGGPATSTGPIGSEDTVVEMDAAALLAGAATSPGSGWLTTAVARGVPGVVGLGCAGTALAVVTGGHVSAGGELQCPVDLHFLAGVLARDLRPFHLTGLAFLGECALAFRAAESECLGCTRDVSALLGRDIFISSHCSPVYAYHRF